MLLQRRREGKPEKLQIMKSKYWKEFWLHSWEHLLFINKKLAAMDQEDVWRVLMVQKTAKEIDLFEVIC